MVSLRAMKEDSRLTGEQLVPLMGTMYNDLARAHGRARRQAAGREALDLLAWGRKYLARHFQRPPSRMHRWLARRLDMMRSERGVKLNVLAPRGSAKSTLGTLAFPLRAALEGWEPYVWIVSDTRHQACAHLENIKAELLDNRQLARDYPEAAGRGPVWRAGAVVLRNGATIEAFGTGQRIRGRRHGAWCRDCIRRASCRDCGRGSCDRASRRCGTCRTAAR